MSRALTAWMTHCDGCGFNVEPKDAGTIVDPGDEHRPPHCSNCTKCNACPDMRESYRRGFNAGIDKMISAVQTILEGSSALKRLPP